jgi:hypothetical protein
MSRAAFEHAIREALTREASLDELHQIVRRCRDEGLTQQAALDVLSGVRADVPEPIEDRILEVMDRVSGFCAPGLRLWSE